MQLPCYVCAEVISQLEMPAFLFMIIELFLDSIVWRRLRILRNSQNVFLKIVKKNRIRYTKIKYFIRGNNMSKVVKRLLAFVLAISMINFTPNILAVQAVKGKEEVVIDVTDYGADPSGKNDSTEAVMNALEAAKAIDGDKTLKFPYGEYRFDVSGAEEVKLITKEYDNNAYDHSEWADACFTRSLGENTLVREEVVRLFGTNRYETGYKVADALKEELGVEKFDAVVIATGKNFPDGLCGGPLAAAMNAPLILTADGKTEAAEVYVQRENIQDGYVLGGECALLEKTVIDIFGIENVDEIIEK